MLKSFRLSPEHKARVAAHQRRVQLEIAGMNPKRSPKPVRCDCGCGISVRTINEAAELIGVSRDSVRVSFVSGKRVKGHLFTKG